MGIIAARLFLAGLAGWLIYTGNAPIGWWPAAIVGMTLLYAAFSPWGSRHLRTRSAMLIAFTHTMVLYLFMLPWIGELVGIFPYVALAFTLSLHSLLLGWAAVPIARWKFGFLVFPFFFITIEWFRSAFPFGGFPWVRLAWGQVEGPLANLMAWGGPALVSFAAAVMGTSLWALFRGPTAARVTAVFTAIIPVGLGLIAGLGINNPANTTDTINVAAVQGNVPRLGLEFNDQRRAVLENHVRETKRLAENNPDLDIVLWPENSSDVNPFNDAQARELIKEASEAVGVPLMVGTLTEDEVGIRNTMQVFDAEGNPADRHYKKYLQPFGETMPFREILKYVSEYVELAGDYKPGNGPGVVTMGDITVGIATCYEVIFDDSFRTAVKNGAQILSTPTNNATFGFSDMTYQQLAMSRMRAIETDRAVVVPATSGVSAIVRPDGTVSQSTEIFEADNLVEELPLREGQTIAVRYGSIVQLVLVLIGIAGAAAALWVNRLPSRALTKVKSTE